MKFWKLSHDKAMYDFERMLFYSLKTVFTEILKTRKLKWHYLCLQMYITSYEAIIFFYTTA
jgi:hypothetical protein